MKKIVLGLVLAISLIASDKAINWTTSYYEALELANKENKPLLVLYARDSCPFCIKLKENTLSHEAIIKVINEGFVPLYIDVKKNRAEAVKIGISLQAVPTTIILDSNKMEIDRVMGAKDPMSYMRFLQGGAR